MLDIDTQPPDSRDQATGAQAVIGNVVLAEESVIDPATTLAIIDAMLTQPDQQGRMLPHIELVEMGREDAIDKNLYWEGSEASWVNNEEGEKIGFVEVTIDDEEQSESFGWVETSRQGEGFGLAIYLTCIKRALERGHDFRNDFVQTTAAAEIWRRLVELGLAAEIRPFRHLQDGSDRYSGVYVVNGNNRPKTIPENV